MSDQEIWDDALRHLRQEYGLLPTAISDRFRLSAAAIRDYKSQLQSLVEDINGGEICGRCEGECCVRGKYHVTVIDILIHLDAGRELSSPSFDQDRCPYLACNGCSMTADFRPFNCITFNCDRVEGLLEPANVERFYHLERALRQTYQDVEALFGNRFMHGLFINFERDIKTGGCFLKFSQERVPA